MKLSAIFCLLLVISSSFASQSTYQPKLSAFTTKDKLGQSHFGKAILKMVELGNTQSLDFDELNEALDALKQSLANGRESEQDQYSDELQEHQSNVNRLQGLIDQYEADQDRYEEIEDSLSEELELFQRNLAQAQQQLSQAQTNLEAEGHIMDRRAQQYDENVGNYQEVLDLLEEAIQALEQSGRLQGAEALVQLQAESMTNLGEKLQKKLHDVKSSLAVTKPLEQFFVQVKNGNTQNASVSRAIEALQNLAEFYEAGLEGLTENFNQANEKQQLLIDELNLRIRTLTQVQIPTLSKRVESINEQLEGNAKLIAETVDNLRLQNENLEQENASWEARTAQFEELMDSYDREQAIVEQAETIIRGL